MPLIVFIAVCWTNILFAYGVACLPMPDSGPHIANDWGEPVRLRHLYAARHGLHLQISKDGKVDGSILQSSHSLLEISPVETGCVAIKAVASSRYLCMEENGKLYGSHSYMKGDCSFVERILPDGYSVYVSGKHGIMVSLSGGKNRPKGRDRGNGVASQFLPMASTLSLEPGDLGSPADLEQGLHLGLEIDSMDPFGKVSQIVIQSPSFNKR